MFKTVNFKDLICLWDPINAVKIFNYVKADELAFLDITVYKESRCVSIDMVKDIGDEAFMPFEVG